MARYHYVKPIRLAHLHDELLAAGITPTLVEGAPDQSQCWLTVPDTTPQASVDAVVAAHDAAAWDTKDQQAAQAVQTDSTNRATLYQTAQSQYQQLQTDIAGWANMTTTQRMAATERTMEALSTTMQVLAIVVRTMKREGT